MVVVNWRFEGRYADGIVTSNGYNRARSAPNFVMPPSVEMD